MYREPGHACPACKAGSLREHEGHLVCDHCNGILIGLGDLAASLTELDGAAYPIEARDGTPEAAVCPRCGEPMRSFTLQRGAHLMRGRYLGCGKDGVWMSRDHMAASYARAGQSGRRVGGFSAIDIAPTGSAGGAMRGIRDAFSHGPPAIERYSLPRPRVHTAFVSAFAGKPLTCPVCEGRALAFEGDRWICAQCAGSFVEDAALIAMISDITAAPWELPAVAGQPGERRCPVCATAMTVEQFEGVTIDRCARHGQWFDDRELGEALLHVGDPPGTVGGWLKRLFHREP